MNTAKEIAAAIEQNVDDVSSDRITWEAFSASQRDLWSRADALNLRDAVGALLTVNRRWNKAA